MLINLQHIRLLVNVIYLRRLTIEEAFRRLHEEWALVGANELASLSGSQLTFVGRTSRSHTNKEFRVLPWLWNLPVGPLFTCTLYFPGEKHTVFLQPDSTDYARLKTEPFCIILVHDFEWEFGLLIDLSADWDWLDHQWTQYKQGEVPLPDVLCAKASILSSLKDPVLENDPLRNGWMEALSGLANSVVQDYCRPETLSKLKAEEDFVRSSSLAFCYEGDAPPTLAYYLHCEDSWESRLGPMREYIQLHKELSGAPSHDLLLGMALMCSWYSGHNTQCGHALPSIEQLDERGYFLKNVPIQGGSFGDRARFFWQRIPVLPIFWFERLIGPNNIPADPIRLIIETPAIEGDVQILRQTQRDLLSEATTYKQWTIPYGAYVQLNIGPIRALKLYEMGHDVYCVFVNDKAEFLLASIDPSIGKIVFLMSPRADTLHEFMEATNAETTKSEVLDRFERFELLLGNLAAAVIRDFWVTEERETVFGVALHSKHKGIRLRSDIGQPAIVYIPKIRYVPTSRPAQNDHALDYETRRPHFVVGHLRHALHAGESQIFLARSLGISIPEGFTFVRPHERGHLAAQRANAERSVIYRSRSALRWLWSVDAVAVSSDRDEWFAYELRVKRWFETNGYEVVHLSGSRNGDGGVDIQAQKGSENLLVQCKYRREKVGPGAIRELLGSLATFPQGSRGVLVSSSELTPGARELARQHGIQFIEGVDFMADLQIRLGNRI